MFFAYVHVQVTLSSCAITTPAVPTTQATLNKWVTLGLGFLLLLILHHRAAASRLLFSSKLVLKKEECVWLSRYNPWVISRYHHSKHKITLTLRLGTRT